MSRKKRGLEHGGQTYKETGPRSGTRTTGSLSDAEEVGAEAA